MLYHPNLGEILNDVNNKIAVAFMLSDLAKHHENEQKPSESVDAPLADQFPDTGCGDSIHATLPQFDDLVDPESLPLLLIQ